MQEGKCGRVFKRERMEEGKALHRAGINKIQENLRGKKPPKISEMEAGLDARQHN